MKKITSSNLRKHDTPIVGDATQRTLIAHLSETEANFRHFLRSLDPSADCIITPAADISPPYDVARLQGGFTTGCLIQWDCSVPIVPVDITMNIDTTSIFNLSNDPGNILSTDAIAAVRRTIEDDSSYLWNFDRGNHFIATTKSDTEWALVLHSNEKEFKNQYNGLSPNHSNWYARHVKTTGGSRPLRFLIGDDAVTFHELASMLVPFNRLRHRIIAKLILGDTCSIDNEWHKEHYYMPSSSSAAIGTYVCNPNEVVLVFSALGEPLMWFEPITGGMNEIILDGNSKLLVPHGWGVRAANLGLSYKGEELLVNGRELSNDADSLFEIIGAEQRRFESNQQFVETIYQHTPGRVIKQLSQVQSYSRHGSLWHADKR